MTETMEEREEGRTLEVFLEGRRREKEQTAFYRVLAAAAEEAGEEELAERLNALHADEQHHLSRLTARILELGGEVPEIPTAPPYGEGLEGWEERARVREGDEVRWYEEAREEGVDPESRRILEEILESERHHARDLGGKWMPA